MSIAAAPPDSSRPMTVVGVAKDAKYAFLGEEPTGFVYVPMQQQYMPRTTIVARAADGRRLAAEIRSLLASMNPNVPVVNAQTFEEYASLGLHPAADRRVGRRQPRRASACCSRRSASTA